MGEIYLAIMYIFTALIYAVFGGTVMYFFHEWLWDTSGKRAKRKFLKIFFKEHKWVL